MKLHFLFFKLNQMLVKAIWITIFVLTHHVFSHGFTQIDEYQIREIRVNPWLNFLSKPKKNLQLEYPLLGYLQKGINPISLDFCESFKSFVV